MAIVEDILIELQTDTAPVLVGSAADTQSFSRRLRTIFHAIYEIFHK